MSEHPEPDRERPVRNDPPRAAGGVLIVLLALVAGSLIVHAAVRLMGDPLIPYSRLRSELRAGNVKTLRASGTRLSGTFARPVTVDEREVERFVSEHPIFVADSDLVSLIERLPAELEPRRKDGGDALHVPALEVEPDNSELVSMAVLMGVTLLAMMLFWLWAARRASRDMGGMWGVNAEGAEGPRYATEVSTGVTFDDVAGLDAIKGEVSEVVDFLRSPEKYQRLGGQMPRGVLLTGPPGTGKTLLARALAGEAEVPFFHVPGSEFIEMYVGVGASRVRELFSRAKLMAPSIVFIDEIDAVGRTRGTGLGRAHDEREQTLNQMLSEMDGFDNSSGVVVLAATNRPDVLDPALLRPGRFDRQIVIPLPERTARAEILAVHAAGKPLADDIDLEQIARRTPGFSGADLANLLNEAAILAARNDRQAIALEDLHEAQDKVMLGASRPDLLRDADDRRRTALHEAGHALAGTLLPHADPVHKVTIIPRGQALGLTHLLPERDRTSASKAELIDMMTMLLAGRAAEELDDPATVSTGAEQDFERVHSLARRMVSRWGMSEAIGPIAYNTDVEHPFLGLEVSQPRNYSDQTAHAIDQEVSRLIRWCYRRSSNLLAHNEATLRQLAEALLEDEVLDGDRVRSLCGSATLLPDPEWGPPRS